MNLSLLQEMIDSGFVKVQEHPKEALYIYNYTPKAQYEQVWNNCTLQCRGLILDKKGKIVARPFPKFFNVGERPDEVLPRESFDVFEKMDGSLGILYWNNGEPRIATRGSFVSDQAVKANQMLQTKYNDALAHLDTDYTYLFEIIYPENRIVVDYGDEESLVLLAVIHKESGREAALPNIGFPVVKKYDGIKDLESLSARQEFNKEGFVIRFRNGFRLKLKFDEYVRVHRIISNVSSISIWENLKNDESFDEMLERVPDEFYRWVRAVKQDLLAQYANILKQAQKDFKVLATRKETALYFQTCSYPSVLFCMLDNKAVEPVIWKMLRPKFEKPFMKEEDI